MADKCWKQFERDAAELIDGKRYTANQGGRVDVEGPLALGQCKEVLSLSLSSLTKLAEEMQEEGRKRTKLGLVFAKHRCGSGRKARTLVVMTDEMWQLMWSAFNFTREQLQKRESHDLRSQRAALPGPADRGQGLDDSGSEAERTLSAA